MFFLLPIWSAASLAMAAQGEPPKSTCIFPLESLVLLSPDPHCVLKKDGTIISHNPAFLKIVPLPSPTILDILNPPDRDSFLSALERAFAGEELHLESHIKQPGRKELKKVEWRFSAPANGEILASGRDISRSARDQHLVHVRNRRELIGTMMGGIVHDFNNLLNVISANLELLTLQGKEFKLPEEISETIRDLKGGTQKMNEFGKRLLSYSRPKEEDMQPTDLSRLLQNLSKLLKSTLTSRIENQLLISGTIPIIQADVPQIERVITNLYHNARDALANRPIKKITTILKVVPLPFSKLAVDGEIPPGNYILLSVADTGCGISSENLKRIFDPYFTTKGAGQGTGLGLHSSYMILKQHGAWIRVESEVDSGTRFEIYFPIPENPLGIPSKATTTEPPAAPQYQGTILLVDDEPQILRVASRFLIKCGYHVVTISDGSEAMEWLQNYRAHPPDIIVTDLIMPRVSGSSLATYCAQEFPKIPVIVMSGHSRTDTPPSLQNLTSNVRELLQKPIEVADLANTIKRLLHP